MIVFFGNGSKKNVPYQRYLFDKQTLINKLFVKQTKKVAKIAKKTYLCKLVVTTKGSTR